MIISLERLQNVLAVELFSKLLVTLCPQSGGLNNSFQWPDNACGWIPTHELIIGVHCTYATISSACHVGLHVQLFSVLHMKQFSI